MNFTTKYSIRKIKITNHNTTHCIKTVSGIFIFIFKSAIQAVNVLCDKNSKYVRFNRLEISSGKHSIKSDFEG